MEFPIFKTKTEGVSERFNLSDPKARQRYFEVKAGPEIKKIKEYLKENTFIAYFLGKKSSGKGTYSKMFAEAVGKEKVDHFSIGDMVRDIDKEIGDEKRRKELVSFLEKNYRGWLSLKEINRTLQERSTKTLLPTDLILAFVKREIAKREKKAVFIDGFPRDLGQISYSLFFRDLIGYRDDPDIFVLIDVPEAVIDERIKWRRVCPICQTSRNLKLLPTSKIGYDKAKKEFYLICDNPDCQGTKMVAKEGDEFGIAPIRERLKKDEELIQRTLSLYGIPKIFLRNSVPVGQAKEFVDDYEITPEYHYEWDAEKGRVKIQELSWIVKDDDGKDTYSLLAPPVAVSLISQVVEVLNL